MVSPSTCNKCRRSTAVEGETWCGGCLALDGCLASLKGNWWSSTHRRLGEEILIQAHRQLKAVKSLDTALQSFSDSWEAKYRKLANSGAQRPPHPVLPPRGRASLTEAPQVPPAPPPPAPVVKEEARGSGEGSPEREGSDRSESPNFGGSPSRSPTPRGRRGASPKERASSPVVEAVGTGHRGWERVEQRQRTRSPKPRRRNRPHHRGGARHQRHYRGHHERGSGVHQPQGGAARDPRTIRGILDSDI